MRFNTLLPDRYKLYLSFFAVYLAATFSVRLAFYVMSFSSIDFSLLHLIRMFGTGLIFDVGAALFILLAYALYLLAAPSRIIGTLADKIFTFFVFFLTSFVAIFSLLAEFPFWQEFSTRFNFIAVDYLIYTYEVVENINQSFPIPLLIGFILSLIFGVYYLFKKNQVFQKTFDTKIPFLQRLKISVPIAVMVICYISFVENKFAEWSTNLYENEISKNGVYSFGAAFRSNELDFDIFYQKLPYEQAFALTKQELKQVNQTYISSEPFEIRRQVTDTLPEKQPVNIVLICMESMSASFMKSFGNEQNITPTLDNLFKNSVHFDSLYATGTRTVRGMEALTLCVPPTPGNSIVRRLDNSNLESIATVLSQKNYQKYFVYGGDGYFDNMNTFFGGQGFTIVDRNRGNPLSDNIKTQRINIENNEVSFENAWGISDEDIYNKTLKLQDENFSKNEKSFYFLMTTSNHKPYTFPAGKIDIAQGSREGAVKFADYALGEYLAKARTKAWFKNTVFVIVADHCASSAGKWEINIAKHHIPAIIYNLEDKPLAINKLVSQIDIMPTLFGLLHWNYTTALYGKDITKMVASEERALIGNYRTLGLLTKNHFTEINDRRQIKQYALRGGEMYPQTNVEPTLKNRTIAYYQTASYRFKQKLMKEKPVHQ